MAAINVGIRHDDDLVVAQLSDAEFILADSRAQGCDQGADFLRAEHSVETGALDVQYLAAQR